MGAVLSGLGGVWAVAAEEGMAAVADGEGGGGFVQRLSLADAIERGLAHNRDLVRGALELTGDVVGREQAREVVRHLVIAPEGGAGHGSSGDEFEAGVRGEVTGGWGTRVAAGAGVRQLPVVRGADVRRDEVRVEISQPLFRQFGPLVRNEPVVAANEAWLAARRAWERDRSGLALRVVEQYEGLIFLAHQMERDVAFAGRMERLAALTAARERQGRAARTEALRVELQRGEAEARLAAGRAQLGIQYQAFADLLGLPLESRFELVAPDLLALDEADASRAVAVALACRPDYAQALQDIETADRQLRIARRQLLPDLRLTARHTSYGEGEEWREAGRLDESDWFVGLMGELNLNVREARLGVRRAAIDAEARRQVAEIVRNRLALEVNAGWAQYRQARTQLDLAARNAGLAANRAELARSLFEAGRASADSVSDAEMDRVNAELSELAARREASVAAYRLLHGLGTLVPAPPEILAQEER